MICCQSHWIIVTHVLSLSLVTCPVYGSMQMWSDDHLLAGLDNLTVSNKTCLKMLSPMFCCVHVSPAQLVVIVLHLPRTEVEVLPFLICMHLWFCLGSIVDQFCRGHFCFSHWQKVYDLRCAGVFSLSHTSQSSVSERTSSQIFVQISFVGGLAILSRKERELSRKERGCHDSPICVHLVQLMCAIRNQVSLI